MMKKRNSVSEGQNITDFVRNVNVVKKVIILSVLH